MDMMEAREGCKQTQRKGNFHKQLPVSASNCVPHTSHRPMKIRIWSHHLKTCCPRLAGSQQESLLGSCGIIRVKINEVSPLYPRFQVPPGDVILEEELLPDEASAC